MKHSGLRELALGAGLGTVCLFSTSVQAQVAQGPAPTLQNPGVSGVSISPEKPGVMTEKGVLVVEPSIEYQHTSVNTFVAGGVAILDTVLIGNIQASQANRDAITATMAFRYGITNHLEAEVRVPYMYRHDTVTNTIVNLNNSNETTDLSDSGIGDVEAALHYQINDGNPDWPIFVTNLRLKSDTGKGPFDVSRDANGVAQQLATGSGFWGVEPSVTVIAPSDPAVFYANVGYLYNVSASINKPFTSTSMITHSDPGGAVRLGLGMGIALNEKVSLALGYQEDFIRNTKTKFSDGSISDSGSLSVGTLNIGVNWQRSPDTALNINVGIGVTQDAPDVRLLARVPISIHWH